MARRTNKQSRHAKRLGRASRACEGRRGGGFHKCLSTSVRRQVRGGAAGTKRKRRRRR